jgi:NAD(P)-dependent dehydrogenase (short-subunit alcohol dehydrogenase family)
MQDGVKSAGLLITGGTKGLGFAIARCVARPGLALFLSYRSDDAAAVVAKRELSDLGATVHLIKRNVGTPEEGAKVIDEIARHVDVLSGIVHCAAVPNPGYLLDQEWGEIDEAVRVGGLALLYLVQPAMRMMGEDSSVIFLSGAAIDIALPKHGALALAKAAGEMAVRHLAIECGARGIRFNTLRSGPVDTQLFRDSRGDGSPPATTPRGRALKANDVGEAASFLLSPAASMITGQHFMVDGGLNATIRSERKHT